MDNACSPIYRGNDNRAFVFDLIRSITMSNPPQLPESEIIDLKREAQEECSLNRLKSMIKRSQKLYRRSSVFRKDCMSWSSGWKKGRLFNTYDNTLLMTPTNKSSVSWLDLAEYTLDYGKNFPNSGHVRSAILRTSEPPRVVNVYHIETSRRDSSRKCRLSAKNYMNRIEECMRREMMYNTALTLTHRWDSGRFVRYTNSVDYMLRVDSEFHLTIFPRLLIQHCNDSKIVVRYFLLLSSDNPCLNDAEYIVKHMDLPCLHFFMLHIMNAVRAHRRQEECMCWITKHLGLIEKAFRTGQNKTLELLLGFGWPCEFYFNLGYDHRVSKLNWPRKTVDWSAKSFISPAFTAVLVLYLIKNSRRMETTIPITDCIRLFWRSVPTPYVSLDDLQRLVNIMVKADYKLELIFIMHLVHAKWTSEFISFYPTDCLATYQPRSLLHLTRCKIREIIGRMVNVKFLPLPNNLKEYLWLKW